MIEAYAFLAMFMLQILTMSVLNPTWFIRYCRAKAAEFPAEGFPKPFSGFFRISTEHFLTLYRAVNTGIAVLGSLLLGWLFGYVEQPEWARMAFIYFMLQMSPLLLLALIGLRYFKVHRSAMLDGKRTAVLQRRGLFDFVSPFTVFLAVLGYFLFVAYMIYLARNPHPGSGDPLKSIGFVTLGYAWNALWMYKKLYGRKLNPLDTSTGRRQVIGAVVRIGVYSCIVLVVLISLVSSLSPLELQRWKPVIVSAFLVTSSLLFLLLFAVPPRVPEADELGSSPVS